MTSKTLKQIAAQIQRIDVAFLVTRTAEGTLSSRPMSNNRDVEYNGDSYYFTTEDADSVAEIEEESQVLLAFNGDGGLYVSVAGEAEIIRDKRTHQDHWVEDLEAWFKEGVDTPGLVLIKVSARRMRYWDGEESGEISSFG